MVPILSSSSSVKEALGAFFLARFCMTDSERFLPTRGLGGSAEMKELGQRRSVGVHAALDSTVEAACSWGSGLERAAGDG